MGCSGCGGVLKPGGGCGCNDCPPGSTGANGTNGLSAYEIWIQEGNVGTEQEFLDSLVGATGANGTNGIDGVCPCEEVLSSEERLGAGSVGTAPTYAVVTGTQYTVPVGGGGDYRILFTSEVLFPVAGGSLSYSVYVNGLIYGTMTRSAIFSSAATIGTSLNISGITLIATDVIEIRGTSDDPANTYLSYGTCIIEKIT